VKIQTCKAIAVSTLSHLLNILPNFKSKTKIETKQQGKHAKTLKEHVSSQTPSAQTVQFWGSLPCGKTGICHIL